MAEALYTIGHGARTLDELAAALAAARVEALVDVRAFPRSRRHPQFNRAALASGLGVRGIRYEWAGGDFGGRRPPHPDSRHTALALQVRGFADYMATGAFRAALERLLARTAHERVAIMCAEREPLECHRALISDAALARGTRVVHLGVAGRERPARLDPAARVVDGVLLYDGGQVRLPGGDGASSSG